ncbi:MAG: putative toxin-antitoxin system toxin component, PIN family [Deltaproteobacteria bacterium]|nr:putative toxin-antitoxin system toxin component, PIN family [Deltaproteobacteria bacterium]
MKIVLDANVIIAAFASRGLCESIMEVCLSKHEIVLCDELLEEVLRNLRLKIKLSDKIVDDISDLLLEQATKIKPVSLPTDICRDPEDVKILGLAVAADAHYIVTGDKDLLVLEAFQGIPILTPRAFSNLLQSEEE